MEDEVLERQLVAHEGGSKKGTEIPFQVDSVSV